MAADDPLHVSSYLRLPRRTLIPIHKRRDNDEGCTLEICRDMLGDGLLITVRHDGGGMDMLEIGPDDIAAIVKFAGRGK